MDKNEQPAGAELQGIGMDKKEQCKWLLKKKDIAIKSTCPIT